MVMWEYWALYRFYCKYRYHPLSVFIFVGSFAHAQFMQKIVEGFCERVNSCETRCWYSRWCKGVLFSWLDHLLIVLFSVLCDVWCSGSPNQVTGTSKQSLSQNLQQQNTRLPTAASGNYAKGPTLSDEFKNGFPSEGLSVVSNKWWGSNSCDEADTKEDTEHKPGNDPAEMKSAEENGSNNMDLSGTSLLTTVRRKAVTEGREALKLGVFRGRSIHDTGDRERTLLLGLFHSSLPKEWMEN